MQSRPLPLAHFFISLHTYKSTLNAIAGDVTSLPHQIEPKRVPLGLNETSKVVTT